MGQIQFDDFHIDVRFTVYDGDERTLPKEGSGSVQIILFDDDEAIHRGSRVGKNWHKQCGNGLCEEIRISVGDAWSGIPTPKLKQCYPRARGE